MNRFPGEPNAVLAPVSKDSTAACVTVGHASVSKLNLGPGYWKCWAPEGDAAKTFRLRYLAPNHIALTGDLDAPVAAANGQTAVSRMALIPSDTSFELLVPAASDGYWAIMWDGAADVQLNCTRVIEP